MYLSSYYKTDLYERETLIIFDEVQLYPRARSAIKYLVADGRYDYIETGSLISIKKNVENILIPSEERHLNMYPMDFEEFLWAKGYDDTTVDDIIRLSETSKGSFYYYFSSKDSLLDTLSTILDENYAKLEDELDPEMNSFDKLMYLNYRSHSFMEQKIDVALLSSLYSTQLIAKGDRNLLDQNRTYYKLISRIIEEGHVRNQISREKSIQEITKYYSLCERALVSDWCLNRGNYSLGEYSKEYMPILMEHFRVDQPE